MQPPNLQKAIAELSLFKEESTGAIIEIASLNRILSTIIQSQISYTREKKRNIAVANMALRTGLSLQAMFKANTEIYKLLQVGWELPESKLRKILKILTQT